MAYTLSQLTALEDAISQGVLEVKYADKTVTYRSLDDMLRTKGMIEKALNPNGVSSRKLAVHNKGFYPSNNLE